MCVKDVDSRQTYKPTAALVGLGVVRDPILMTEQPSVSETP